MSNSKESFEKIYQKPKAIWTKRNPHIEFKSLIENDKIKRGRALDIACGEGFNSIYLAESGFDVLGIDISEKAIEYSRKNAKKANFRIRFKTLDIENLKKLKEKFDFVLEWGLLHLIPPSKRKSYAKNVYQLLNKGSQYLSVCFNDQSPEYGDINVKVRKGLLGTTLYYSSPQELQELFSSYFKIQIKKLINITGKNTPDHLANFILMQKT